MWLPDPQWHGSHTPESPRRPVNVARPRSSRVLQRRRGVGPRDGAGSALQGPSSKRCRRPGATRPAWWGRVLPR